MLLAIAAILLLLLLAFKLLTFRCGARRSSDLLEVRLKFHSVTSARLSASVSGCRGCDDDSIARSGMRG